MNNRRIISALLAFCILVLTVGISIAQTAKHGIDVPSMDRNAAPCSDFYEYANGNWLKRNEIPADRAGWGSFYEVMERNSAVLHDVLEKAASDTAAPKGGIEWKVGEFYRTAMDTKKIEAEGATPLKEEFERIAGIQNASGVQDEIARLHRKGITPAFAFFVYPDFKNSSVNIAQLYQAGLGMPDRDYYLNDDPKMQEIRKQYVEHITKMLQLLGDEPAKAASEAQTIMTMETRLAKVSMTPVEQRDPNAVYNKMTVAELNHMAPNIAWTGYFNTIGLKDPGGVNVGQPKFFKEVDAMISDVGVEDWKTYLRWQLLHGTASRLSEPFVNEDFHFNGTVIAGTKELRPRWKRVVETIDQRMGEASGQLWAAKAFPPEYKARALELVNNVKAGLRERLSKIDWIDEDTRKQALRKLDAITVKIGYPDKWRDYSKLAVDQNAYVLNVMQADEFEFQRNLDKVGKPVDKSEWQMTPPTVNAYYDPTFNDINFPAGILQPPFFDGKADDGSNYGGIGMVIGHELTHGFDDQGRQFDAEGNLKNWWTDQDLKNFKERSDFVDKQYSAYTPLENMHINGKLTLGENIADIGGLKIAYIALEKALAGKKPEKIDGLTPEQRFFIAFAQIWRSKERPEMLRLRLTTNPHSPSKFRVIGPLSDTPEFNQAFACPKSEAPEAARVSIW